MDARESSASYAKFAEQRHFEAEFRQRGNFKSKTGFGHFIVLRVSSSLWPRIVVIVYGRYIGQCLDGPVSLLLPPICRIG